MFWENCLAFSCSGVSKLGSLDPAHFMDSLHWFIRKDGDLYCLARS